MDTSRLKPVYVHHINLGVCPSDRGKTRPKSRLAMSILIIYRYSPEIENAMQGEYILLIWNGPVLFGSKGSSFYKIRSIYLKLKMDSAKSKDGHVHSSFHKFRGDHETCIGLVHHGRVHSS